VEQQQQQDKKVMMIGDGLNDAGALQQSDVGLVITENLNNFSPSCDAILAADQLPKLPAFLQLARTAKRIVLAAYGLALIYNVIGLSFAVQGLLSPVIAAILMPLSSVTIVLFGMGMSGWLGRRVLGG
jgi:Cu+-exporting ATPase